MQITSFRPKKRFEEKKVILLKRVYQKEFIEMPKLPLDEQWKIVKEHYEKAYKVQFKKQPRSELVSELYQKIYQLTKDLNLHCEKQEKFNHFWR